MDIHIGKLIKEKLKDNQIPVVKFASIINTTRENVYGIFKRKSIDTELLIKISKALQFNFFEPFYSELNIELDIDNNITINSKEAKPTVNEVEYLKKENELLRDIVNLLKQKNVN
jgi:hypothetical protein